MLATISSFLSIAQSNCDNQASDVPRLVAMIMIRLARDESRRDDVTIPPIAGRDEVQEFQ
jgi:hypothetical protein